MSSEQNPAPQPSSQDSYASLENSQTPEKESLPNDSTPSEKNSPNVSDSDNSVAYSEDITLDHSNVIIFKDSELESYEIGPESQEICESNTDTPVTVTTQETASCDMSVGITTQESLNEDKLPAALPQERDTAEIASQDSVLVSETGSQDIDHDITPVDRVEIGSNSQDTDGEIDHDITPVDRVEIGSNSQDTDGEIDHDITPVDKVETDGEIDYGDTTVNLSAECNDSIPADFRVS